MWFTVKRYLLYRLIVVKYYFNTASKKKEIARAYRPVKPFFVKQITISSRMVRWTAAALCGLVLIIAGFQYADDAARALGHIQGRRAAKATASREITVGGEAPVPRKDLLQQPDTTVTESIGRETGIPAPVDSLRTPAPVPYIPEKMDVLLLANKANKSMYVLHNRQQRWSIYREYPMAIGENKGDKMRAGDKKTPEGLYFIVGRKEQNELNAIYGPLAFVLNYPNERDRNEGKSGNGIWIHGTDPDSVPSQTSGCLSLDNTFMREMGAFLKNGVGTPVYIINTDTITTPLTFPDYSAIALARRKIIAEYGRQREQFVLFVQQWKEAWESRDIERYAQFYEHDTFFSQGQRWNVWKEKKAATFTAYRRITITVDNLFLAEYTDNEAVVKFVQGYTSDRLDLQNGKRLSLVKRDGKWYIYQEVTYPQEELVL